MEFYNQTIEKTLAVMKSDSSGLDAEEAKRRLIKNGKNSLPESERESFFRIFLKQFRSPLIYILLIAGLALTLLGNLVDGIIIAFVLLFNSIMGAIQEGRAQSAFLSLRKMEKIKASVLRDGKEEIIPSEEIVIGDIILLKEGEKIPADARIISSNSLKIEEASITGESEPILKFSGIIKNTGVSVADQKNMVFRGTNVVAGLGRAIIIATGEKTFIGKIFEKVVSINTDIPLKKNIQNFSKILVALVISLATVLFFIGVGLNKDPREMLSVVIALVVSIIPEGLPVVVTLVLALGMYRLSQKNVLVKKLQAVEALGQINLLALDKTGTITKNELTVKVVFSQGKEFFVEGSGYNNSGSILQNGKNIDIFKADGLLLAGKIAAISSNAHVSYLSDENRWQVYGDPTEAALSVFAKKIKIEKNSIISEENLIEEFPFDYKTRCKASLCKIAGKYFFSAIGSPETFLENAKFKDDEEKKYFEAEFKKLSSQGFRVIAFAFKESEKKPEYDKNNFLGIVTFGGYYAMKDVLREGIKESVKSVRASGVKPIMITGDHRKTAENIAREAGIYEEGDLIFDGKDIDNMSEEKFSEKLELISVFARVSPEHKMKIINAYRKKGKIVAMTGDGVNDAPSLVAADVGVAMGKIGTEVAKEASDIVVQDDNFSRITIAIDEGRKIIETLKRVILYLFSTSVGEVLIILGALMLGYPLPLLAVQIIWLNFLTDGFLDVSLAMETSENKFSSKDNFKPAKYLIDFPMIRRGIIMVIPMAIGTLFLFSKYLGNGEPENLAKALTISLTVMAVFQWFNAWNCRSESESIFQLKFLKNKILITATILVVVLQLLAVYNPLMQKLLHTVPLSIGDWVVIILVAMTILIPEEIRKFFIRKFFIKQKID